MNIDSSSQTLPITSTPPLRPSQAAQGTDQDGDSGVGRVHQGHRGQGGQMRNAMIQAFQSLGLSLPSQGGNTPTNSAKSSNDGDADDGVSATGNIKKDMRQFMHALFQAVRSEQSSSSATTSSAVSNATNQQGGFSSGLSALIAQVSNGSAPTDLQNAFSALVNDLKQAGASGQTTSGTKNPSVTLQAMLTKLQQNLGYAGSGLIGAGNIISTKA